MMGGDPLLSGFESPTEFGFETRAIRAGQPHDQRTGGVVTPISMSTTFAQDSPGVPKNGYEYSRTGNPTRHAYEACVASLEGAKYGFAFASGLSAEDALFRQLTPGSQILLGNDAYGGTFRLIDSVHGKKSGLANAAVDLTQPEQIKEAWTAESRMVWLETPTNPMLSVFDIRAISDVVHELGGVVVVDNTFATPYLQQPLDLGADVVVHSATKYIGGHSDTLGGAVLCKDPELHETLMLYQRQGGAIMSPFDSYLVQRGLYTLGPRIKLHSENAHKIAEYLDNSEHVKEVRYPGLKNYENHDIAVKQMDYFGGMMSFYLQDNINQEKFWKSLELYKLAVSLGGVETLIELPYLMTHDNAQDTEASAPVDLIRISVGLENVEDLIEDMESALNEAKK